MNDPPNTEGIFSWALHVLKITGGAEGCSVGLENIDKPEKYNIKGNKGEISAVPFESPFMDNALWIFYVTVKITKRRKATMCNICKILKLVCRPSRSLILC